MFMSEISIGSVGGPGPAFVHAFSMMRYSPLCNSSMVADVREPAKYNAIYDDFYLRLLKILNLLLKKGLKINHKYYYQSKVKK